MSRLWISLGALAGLLAVVVAATATHALADERAREIVRSGVQMQGWHALALLGTGLWAPRGGLMANLAGAAFMLGMLTFCSAVYALGFGGLHTGLLAPLGGLLLMLGWVLLGLSAIFQRT